MISCWEAIKLKRDYVLNYNFLFFRVLACVPIHSTVERIVKIPLLFINPIYILFNNTLEFRDTFCLIRLLIKEIFLIRRFYKTMQVRHTAPIVWQQVTIVVSTISYQVCICRYRKLNQILLYLPQVSGPWVKKKKKNL